MRIETQRFGNLTLKQEQLFLFPAGMIGMETLRDWALLPDLENPYVAWLQSASRGDRAIPLVSPRAFFSDYRVQISRRELTGLHMKPGAEIYVLTTLSAHSGKLTTNLRSPVVLNLSRRLGCQVITDNDLPMRQNLTKTHSRTIPAATSVVAANNPTPLHSAVSASLTHPIRRSA